MRILVIGDIHGDWGKLNALITKKSPDIVLSCGDFGWWPALEEEESGYMKKPSRWVVKGVKPGETKVYWCDGNHEDHRALVQDGQITKMYENVFFASRGSTLTLSDGKVVLFAGGAASIDKQRRTPGYDWFPEEVIKDADLDRMMSLDKVDIVISHTAPTSFLPHLKDDVGKSKDPSCVALEYVLKKYNPPVWYFGHWHMYRQGVHKNTHWTCLDHSGGRGIWWKWHL
jgi:predicted phosphodiesterase